MVIKYSSCGIFNIYLYLYRYIYAFDAISLYHNIKDIRIWNQELKSY